jgi:predicted amidohydrolase
MEQGFYPDIISTDLTLRNSLRTDKVYSLLHVMSKYLNMGMSFFDIVRAVTATPALNENAGTNWYPGARRFC